MTTLAEALAFGEGLERPFNCPDEDHGDVHASASVNVAMGVWYCFSCTAHGSIEGHVPTIEDALSVLKGVTSPRTYAEAWLDLYDSYQYSPYWAKRYGDEIADLFRCGTHPWTGNPTYPLRGPDGRPRGVVQRQETDPKYLYPTGVRISDTFFSARRITPNGVVVLVEGASDVMAIHASGQIPRDWSVLGCYGSGVHHPQVSLLRDATPRLIVAAFDNDKAGEAANLRAMVSLAEIAPFAIHRWSYNDPGEGYALGQPVMSDLCATIEASSKPVRSRKKETSSDN